ncbi:6,7-dimethyl-8-ribityllumazine synthase [Sneathiella sp. CAU 1612]|uniref:6,7-dimethyl-8-ribityllumazine synthase n=1 Tax=Sneathiella sedimenti TaxID=2816034 RepID=A0ABS3F0K4_9PROT|nr:6,7-dimethyl-8-ribityllumazine synthase [Sneathiella sedimenti]MBO0332039.1 6,7-dimethyl-8-ribityllumazine synthase [Sneathiella sedimenti]
MKIKNTTSDNKTPSIHKSHNRIAIIQANWHADIVHEASKSFMEELVRYGYDADCFDIHDVPGSLEIPLMAQKLAETGRYDLIMATGLIVDGGIYRHDFVARTVLDAMMRVQLDRGVPILSVVLTPHHFQETQAHMGFFKEHFVVKGQEAAKACHQTLKNMRGLKELKLAS